MDWDRSRLVYRAVKRAFDVVFSGCVLAVIAVPSLVLAAAIRLESEGNPFYSQIRVGQTHRGSLRSARRSSASLYMERNFHMREENVSDKTQFATDAPAGAALIAQACSA